MPIQKSKHERSVLYLWAAFALSVLVRFLIADYLKTIIVYPDEARYYMTAKSLITGHGLTVHNAPAAFRRSFTAC